jgi:hypothetical protein
MKRAIALLAVLLLLCAAMLPDVASAGGRHGHARHGSAWWLPGAIIGGLVLGAAAGATAPLWALAAPPPPVVVAPAPTAYVQAVGASPAPPAYSRPRASAPPPFNRAVVYPNGRYLLFGDGVTHPWQWVWVPASAPPAPPPAPR